MRRLCRFFIILILAYTVAACSGEGTSEVFFFVRPTKQDYSVGQSFMPKEHMQLSTLSDKGEEKPVDVNDQVTISIAKLPYDPDEDEMIPVQIDNGYKLVTAGTNVVKVEYEEMYANYLIYVTEVSGTASTSPGIKIEWAK